MPNMLLSKYQGRMAEAYIGVGTNIGNKNKNIKKAISLLEEKAKSVKISPVYETEPVGYKKQEWFLNCCAKIKTELSPLNLLRFLKSIERIMRRKKMVRFGPRIIDLDILFYNNKIINKRNLVIPHPRLHERLFVLEPLSKIAPGFVHPKLKKNILELRNKLKKRKNIEKVKKII